MSVNSEAADYIKAAELSAQRAEYGSSNRFFTKTAELDTSIKAVAGMGHSFEDAVAADEATRSGQRAQWLSAEKVTSHGFTAADSAVKAHALVANEEALSTNRNSMFSRAEPEAEAFSRPTLNNS